jgi:hypothetical protein
LMAAGKKDQKTNYATHNKLYIVQFCPFQNVILQMT